MIRVIIVEDELHDTAILRTFLNEIGNVEILSEISDEMDAVAAILKYEPDIVFFDIHLLGRPAFKALETLRNTGIMSDLIFTSAYEEYAFKVFEYSNLPYLTKPIDKEKLADALSKFQSKKSTSTLNEKLVNLNLLRKIEFNTENERFFVAPLDIIFCNSDGNYTNIHLSKTDRITVGKPLAIIEKLLPDELFERVHQSFLINKNYLRKLDKKNNICILFKDGTEYPVKFSRRLGRFFLENKRSVRLESTFFRKIVFVRKRVIV